MALTKKRIDVTISLGTGQFGESGSDTVTLTGLRVHVDVEAAGSDSQPQTQVRIYGLPLSMINQLTAIGTVNYAVRFKNSVLIAAGDDDSGMKTIYSGTISDAWGDFNQIPDACLNIMGVGGLASALKPVGALSYPGSVSAATIMQTLATTMGFAFENNGVDVQLSTPYFPGTALNQAKLCARAANIFFAIDRGTLAIWPKMGSRGGDTPVISPATGLVGYPTISSNGLILKTIFNPDVKIGGTVQVQSSLQVACGKWIVTKLAHSLESETPNGQWFTYISGMPGNV